MISGSINKMIAEAMKAGDATKLSTYRLLSSAFNYERIAKQHDLTEEEELMVIRREAKKRKDAIEAYEKVGAKDRAEKEKEELAILEKFLPAAMSKEEIEKAVEEAIKETGATSVIEMGKVMGIAMAKIGARADGGRVSEVVKEKLQ